MSEEKNEFDSLDIDEDMPEQEIAPIPSPQAGLISSGNLGVVYDINSAPDTTKAPPRIDLGGKTVTIKKAEVILPPMDKKWEETRQKDKKYKYCTFKLHYDIGGQVEYFSGMRVFERDGGKYSHPTITRDRKNLASALMGKYADFKQKDINEVTLKEFLSFLNTKPKAVLAIVETKNPQTGAIVKKNVVDRFIG